MPMFSAFFLVAVLSSAGLPGLNGFVGEILCFFGVFAANRTLAVLSVSTVVLSAAYLLWLYRRVMHGPLKVPDDPRLRDLGGRELADLVPIVVLIVFMGLFPGIFLRKMDASISRYLRTLKVPVPAAAILAKPGPHRSLPAAASRRRSADMESFWPWPRSSPWSPAPSPRFSSRLS